jgi:polyhydroxybutyrate depolymerase
MPRLHSSMIAISVVSILTTWVGCSTVLDTKQEALPGTYHQPVDMTYNGLQRGYRLHIPPGYTRRSPAPLVVVVHGAFSNAAQMSERTGWDRLSDEVGFVVAYPEGGGLLGYLQHWNAGYCCGAAMAQEVRDDDLVALVINDVKRILSIDAQRVYMTGFSNGAMLTHRYAALHSHELAAIAPIAGPAGGRRGHDEPLLLAPTPRASMPVLLIHGEADTSIPYRGGPSKGSKKGRSHLSAEESANFWARANGCSERRASRDLLEGAARVDEWQGCPAQGPVRLYSLRHWGHRWPGPYWTNQLPEGRPLLDFDATRIIWAFFSEHSRAHPPGDENVPSAPEQAPR